MIINCYENDAIDQLDDTLLQAALNEDQRKRFGLIHPSFMGGEYLPDCTADETEIARIELRSTLADVISIRAKREGPEYLYSVVDEHGDSYTLHMESSLDTLTLGELVDFIDYSEQDGGWAGGLSMAYNNSNADGGMDRESLEDFTTVTSEIYSSLQQHYQNVYADWVAQEKEKVG